MRESGEEKGWHAGRAAQRAAWAVPRLPATSPIKKPSPKASLRGTSWLVEELENDSDEHCNVIATNNCYKFFRNLYRPKLYLY